MHIVFIKIDYYYFLLTSAHSYTLDLGNYKFFSLLPLIYGDVDVNSLNRIT